jgi:hypothetical protein
MLIEEFTSDPNPSLAPGHWLRRAFRALRGRRAAGGFTLVETLVAAFVILTALGAVFQVSSRCMSIIQCSHNVGLASAMVHERLQQLQATAWETLTDGESYANQVWTDPEDGTTETADGLLKNAPESGAALRQSGVIEVVRISAYRPIPNAAPVPAPITATRNAATATVTSAATNLVDEKMVRIDVRLTWTDARMGIPRSLGASAIVAQK